VTVSELTPWSSLLDIVVDKAKDIDSKLQQKALVDSVLGVCAELGMECTEEKKLRTATIIFGRGEEGEPVFPAHGAVESLLLSPPPPGSAI
jgi:hypothetical protein